MPLPHQWPQHPRSVSCDHSGGAAGGTVPYFTPVAAPAAQKPVVHQLHQGHQARPGYVTLPRRPRTGWSLPRDTPSPGGSSVSSAAVLREPIYDGVGPRTSADGSSRLNLNNSLPIQAVQPHQAHQVLKASSLNIYLIIIGIRLHFVAYGFDVLRLPGSAWRTLTT